MDCKELFEENILNDGDEDFQTVDISGIDNTPNEVAVKEVEQIKAEDITSFTVDYDG